MTTGSILFLCGALEPGHDGVGDYSRLLAGELARSGRPCSILGCKDPWVNRPCRDEVPVATLRLPPRAAKVVAWQTAAGFLREVAPTWISVQFVPYAFHPLGFPLGLPRYVRSLAAPSKARVHMMVHEPWSDGGRGGRLRRASFLAVHRQAFLLVHRRLAPRVTTTTNVAYARRLAEAGIDAEVLPLFSNVPLVPGAEGFLAASLAQAGSPPPPGPRSNWCAAVLFGAWHEGFDPVPALLDLAGALPGIRLYFVSVGGLGPAGEIAFAAAATALRDRVCCVRLGRLPATDVSRCLREADVGFAATPCSLLGKSGSVAALLEHGVPVVATRVDVSDPALPGVHAYTMPLGARWRAILAERPAVEPRLPAHASRLGSLLQP